MLAALAIAALILVMSRGGGGEVVDTEEIKTLYAKSPALYAKVNTALQTNMNPSEVMQLALAVHAAGYPKTAALLIERFGKAVTPVTGKSGTTWNTWSMGPRTDGWIEVHVMYEATPVIAYMQNGADKSSRSLLGIAKLPMGLPADLVEKAKADFV